MSKQPINVLVVEDSAIDAELLIAEISKGGFVPTAHRVDTLGDLQAALEEKCWDLVLSDCNMPRLSADVALSAVRDKGLDVPFIALSGVVQFEDAVSLLKRGAQDFIGKDALARLVPAVERELREATERAQRRVAEQRLSVLSLAVEQSPVSVAICDRSGNIQYVNPRFEAVSGYSSSDVVGSPIDITRDDSADPEPFTSLWAAMEAGEPWAGELCNRAKSRDVFWERASVSPLRDAHGLITHFVAVKEDITEQREQEVELRSALARLTQNNAELERFAYIASHDLQEPLRTVTSYCQMLERKCRRQLSEDADEYITFIVVAARRMHALINDLLAYSRAGEGLSLTQCSAMDACRAALQNLTAAINESRAVIEISHLPDVVADRTQLMQVFQNLIGNAIKFRKPAGGPKIAVAAHEIDGQTVFTVTDDGIGIEPSNQDIFDIFRRLHNANSYPGTGVGLSICKRIIERHGGRIWVRPAPAGGSTFHFSLGPGL